MTTATPMSTATRVSTATSSTTDPCSRASGSTRPPEPNAINAANSTSTGYFTRKYFDGYYTKGMSGNWNFDAPLIRLATIYLVYAEAVTRSKGATPEVYNLMNELRARSFMAPIPPAAQTNKELLLDYILRERRVELYHEKSRFFSTRFYLRTDQPRRTGQGCPVEFDPGDERPGRAACSTNTAPTPRRSTASAACAPWKTPTARYRWAAKPTAWNASGRTAYPREALPTSPIPTEELQRANIPQNPNW